MDFFSKVGNTISSKSKDVAKKAKEIAEVTNISSQIASKENSIRTLYTEIGKIVYGNYKEDKQEEVIDKFTAIDTYLDEIAALQVQMKAIKGIQVCPGCGSEVDIASDFCPKCGAKMPEKVEPVADDFEEAAEDATAEAADDATAEAADDADEAADEAGETTEE